MRGLSVADVIFVLGLGAVGYGLWTFKPWISFVVVGAIVMWLGVGMLRGERGRRR